MFEIDYVFRRWERCNKGGSGQVRNTFECENALGGKLGQKGCILAYSNGCEYSDIHSSRVSG